MTAAISLTWPEEDIALLTLDVPQDEANHLSPSVLQELDLHLQSLSQRDDVAGMIICSGKPGSFVDGADLAEITRSFGDQRDRVLDGCRQGQQLLIQLSRMPFVSVAATEGTCTGRGAELAAWCDRRLFSDDPRTEFGFPQVNLGVLPCWGGTARVPRVIGLAPAIEMICGGRTIDSHTAVRLGWASSVVPSSRLLDAAIRLVREEQRTGSYRVDSERLSQPLHVGAKERDALRVLARTRIEEETGGHCPASLAGLELILESSALSLEEALAREREVVVDLLESPVHAALVNVVLLADGNRAEVRRLQAGRMPRAVLSVGIVGAGIMGAGIAAAAVKANLPVSLVDMAPTALERAARQIAEELASDKQIPPPRAAEAPTPSALLRTGTRAEDVVGSDLIVEAVVEKTDVKRALFASLEQQIGPEIVLASNTSTLPITHLAKGLIHPERFVGMHFFNPVSRKLVEIIRGARTSDETVAAAVAFAVRIGKMPIVVRDGPGFLVNRLLFPYMNEAIELMLDGAPLREIDEAALAFGLPMGPVALYDVVGIDTSFYAGRTMWTAFPERVLLSPLVMTLMKAGRLGKKTGRGFYCYENEGQEAEDDPSVMPFIDKYRRENRHVSRDEIIQRLLLAMLQEATRLIDDEVVGDVRDIDLGAIYGAGFPAFRGGLMFWADSVGLPQILDWLRSLERLGPRMAPTERLLRMARQGETFYGSRALKASAWQSMAEAELAR